MHRMQTHTITGRAFINNISSVYYQHENNELLVGTKGDGLEAFKIDEKKFVSYYKESADTLHEQTEDGVCNNPR